jgi:hypothetical protein
LVATFGPRAAGAAEQTAVPPPEAILVSSPMLDSGIARPLRYQPEGTDFVIQNGPEFFNRSLYCMNSPFRVDGGDRPEFSLYLPGRGGNLRLGLKTGAGMKWLHEAQTVVARYRPGSLVYDIDDPLLGTGALRLTVLPLDGAKGIVGRVRSHGVAQPVELVLAFGGANGQKGARGGDIGCERQPVSEFFQLRPEQCRGNTFTLSSNTFVLRGKPGAIAGIMPAGAKLAIADATKWSGLDGLLASAGQPADLQVMLGRVAAQADEPLYFVLQPLDEEVAACKTDELPRVFAAAEAHRKAVAERVAVETPDPFINAAAAALCVAADGVWDEKEGTFMHGAVAWRTKLLGWRGPYSGDALGWHDRTARHLSYFAGRQNTNEIPSSMPPADRKVNLTRNEAALHSNGDMSHNHYDMNLVAMDALFRHLLWTGDLDFARQMWPVIERHLAWERRLFRRPFGPDQLPLYEAYCCIWASDNMQYDGGGAAHSTAYNYYQNKMAARLATLLGKDAAPYQREAGLIAKAMRRELWLADRGWFAESRDYLGLQSAHPNPGLWTFYHTIDSEVPAPLDAWQMTRFVDTQIARIPIRGPGVPAGNFYTLPTTSWMPYIWSLNNVVMAEVAHTSLAYWQAGRPEAALPVFKGCLLDSMYLGLCPGNVGMCTWYDMARRESQRDFADGVGATSRALVEGLFGVRPDALAGELLLRPGFPADWDHASLNHPDLAFRFRREGEVETYTVESRFPKPMALRLQAAALLDRVAGVTADGHATKWLVVDDSVGAPRIEIEVPPAPSHRVVITWKGEKPSAAKTEQVVAQGGEIRVKTGPAHLREIADPESVLTNQIVEADSFQASASGALGHRTVFAKVRQGDLVWWLPVPLEVRAAGEILQTETQDAAHLRFRVRNNSSEAIDSDVTISVAGRVTKQRLQAPAYGESAEVALPAEGLLPGSNPVVITVPLGREGDEAKSRVEHSARLGSAVKIQGVVINWRINADSKTAKLEQVDLSPVFNDKVARIFKNEYLSPRSPFCSLQTPEQGLGGWCDYSADCRVDDTGLRAAANLDNGRFLLPQGIPFRTPGAPDAQNIAFVSQWNNFPSEVTLPLGGNASRAYLLMAGSSNPMQSRFDNGEVIVTYADGSTERLALQNPDTWWPIDQDYFIDDFAFRRSGPIPPRVDLRTGAVRVLDLAEFKGKGGKVPGGAATVLDLPLDPSRQLKSLTVRAVANEVVVGLMSLTLAR